MWSTSEARRREGRRYLAVERCVVVVGGAKAGGKERLWVARAQFGQVRAGRVVIDKASAGRAAAVEDAGDLAGDVPEGIASDHAGE